MVHPLQAVPISAATASSTSSEVDEEIICKEKDTAEAETPVSDFNIPLSDHGPSTPIPHSPMKIPEGAIVHDTAPENYKSDAVVEEPDQVAVEALESLAKAGEEPSKSKADDQEKSVQEPDEKVANPASDNDEDDDSSDDDNDENDNEASLSHLQQNEFIGPNIFFKLFL
ncbi:histone H2A.Z-specific chaperone CHZ1-like [Daucus carota subsp. sativus]|uniref:histone H2A.Z-specific chaperone CHZ1-like n=1 Tax=Daucus carota subsp. sativus TaxID=79200 RepID=UPI003083A96B